MPYETTVEVINRQGQRITLTLTTDGATFEEITAAVANLGQLPTSIVSAASKKTAQAIRRTAKGVAPKRTGALRKGIVVSRKKERSRTRGKAVWDVWIDSGMNDVFAKQSSGLKSGRAYYPASMEYGFRTRSGRHYAGYGYLQSAADAFVDVHEQLTTDEVSKRLDKLWAKKQRESDGD